MPEGDTVHRTARRLHRALSGQPLTGSDFRVPQHATADLTGATVTETVARGKHLLTRFSGDLTLHTHLKMEGAWQIYETGQRWRRPAHQARVALTTDAAQAVGFSLGIVELLPTADEHTVVGHLGPDPLGPDWDEDEAVRRLGEDPDRPLMEALLDQTRMAGIGNMWAAELCFLSGVLPTMPVGQVADLARLVRRAKLLLEAGSRGQRWVYRRDRSACRRCGSTLVSGMVGTPPRDRRTYWCPSCQPRT